MITRAESVSRRKALIFVRRRNRATGRNLSSLPPEAHEESNSKGEIFKMPMEEPASDTAFAAAVSVSRTVPKRLLPSGWSVLRLITQYAVGA